MIDEQWLECSPPGIHGREVCIERVDRVQRCEDILDGVNSKVGGVLRLKVFVASSHLHRTHGLNFFM